MLSQSGPNGTVRFKNSKFSCFSGLILVLISLEFLFTNSCVFRDLNWSKVWSVSGNFRPVHFRGNFKKCLELYFTPVYGAQ